MKFEHIDYPIIVNKDSKGLDSAMIRLDAEGQWFPCVSRRGFMIAGPLFLTAGSLATADTQIQTTASHPVKLWIDGDIAARTSGNGFEFSQQSLDALPQIEFATSTIWTDDVVVFSGPTLKAVLESADPGSGDVIATAINQYRVTIPRSYIEDDAPIVATRINGKPFSVREKGPLWIVFPYDRAPEFQTELIYAMTVWQLERLTVAET